MDGKIAMLAMSQSLDDLCIDNDIDPEIVIRWMVMEGFLEPDDYFEYEEDELDEQLE